MKSKAIISFEKKLTAKNEAEVETFAIEILKKYKYGTTQRSCRNPLLNLHWPSKQKGAGKTRGYPDILLYAGESNHLVCVWENKAPSELVDDALTEAKFYIEGLRLALPNEPGLPRFAVGYNGRQLRMAVFGNDGKWRPIIVDGSELKNAFIIPELLMLGVNSQGVLIAPSGAATANDIRRILPDLKTLYRTIPKLASGRAPIDFTVALLTLKLVLETEPEWGYWSEQPRFTFGAKSTDHALAERFSQLAKRILEDSELKIRYGDIFLFKESADGGTDETFDFLRVIDSIQKGNQHFEKMFTFLDQLPPLHGAEFDVFGEVYQALGDEATKKKLGEFFTGRHIISGILPILFERASLNKSFAVTSKKKMADIACGTGGFLTEMLRLTKKEFSLSEEKVSNFAKKAFYGYDLSSSNASRARVNMYFAGDGFSEIRGGFDTLSNVALKRNTFDIIATNPPYGQYHDGRIEEAFLEKMVDLLVPGVGWGCIVLPTGTIENPRSENVRFNLLRRAQITDVIALPKHAFAPYTQQRTVILIFVRRKKEIAADLGDWKSLVDVAGNEAMRFFIIDNDGYANSDKRYRTDRIDSNGSWLHDDLSDWVDRKNTLQKGKVYSALINGHQPKNQVDESGAPVGPKYGEMRLSLIVNELRNRGVPLLPDVLLRSKKKTVSIDDWVSQVATINSNMTNEIEFAVPLREQIETLISTELIVQRQKKPSKLIDLFSVTKGNQNLTEVAIYRSVVSSGGIPVYGGGAKAPRFKVALGLRRENGLEATLFEGPALLLAMDGSSGSIQVIESGTFYCNHHGAVLKPRAKDTNIWCVAQLIESRLRNLASNQGSSATLTVNQVENLPIVMPSMSNIEKIADARKILAKLSRFVA